MFTNWFDERMDPTKLVDEMLNGFSVPNINSMVIRIYEFYKSN